MTLRLATVAAAIVVRACARCHKDLEDPASVESGLGPICRGQASRILAKEIRAAWSAEALSAFFLLDDSAFLPEATSRFASAYQGVMLSKGANSADEVAGEDLRAQVRELAYLASVAKTSAAVEAVLGAIRGMGYPAYAAYVAGESATGAASVALLNGRLQLDAVRNSAGAAALRNVGARWDRAAGVWAAPIEKAEAFVQAVRIYWPLVTGAEQAIADAKAALAPAPAPAPRVVLRPDGATFTVAAPYRAAFILALKTAVPFRGRSWDGLTKTWRVARAFEPQVRALLAQHFGELDLVEA